MSDDGPVCAVCLEPIVPADYWETYVCPSDRGAVAVHITCLWELERSYG